MTTMGIHAKGKVTEDELNLSLSEKLQLIDKEISSLQKHCLKQGMFVYSLL